MGSYLSSIEEETLVKRDNNKKQILKQERLQNYRKVYYLENFERISNYGKVWRLEHPEYMSNYCKIWRLDHPDYYKVRALERY